MAYASQTVSPRQWTQSAHQALAKIAIDFYRKYGDVPQREIVENELRAAVPNKNREAEYLAAWSALEHEVLGIETPKWLRDKLTSVGRHGVLDRFVKSLRKGETNFDAAYAEFTRKWDTLGTDPSKSQLYSVAGLRKVTAPRWQVRNQFPQESTVCIYGPSYSGKSFLALDWALCSAAGKDWHGAKVQPCSVLYVYSEGFAGLPKRVWAWQQHFGVSDAELKNIVFSGSAHNLAEESQRLLKQAETALGAMPRLIIIDTLARNYEGSESDDEAMRAFVGALDWLKKMAKASVVVVHHQGKDRGKGLRGHSSFGAAIETTIHVEASADLSTMKVSCEKQKDYDVFPDYRLAKKIIEVGTDEEGEPVTSCVWLPVSEEDTAKVEQSRDAVERISILSCFKPGIKYNLTEAVKLVRNCWQDGNAPGVNKVKAQLAYMRDANEIQWETGDKNSFLHWVEG